MRLSECRDFDDLREFLNSGDDEPRCYYVQDGKVKSVWLSCVRFMVNEDVDGFDWSIVEKGGFQFPESDLFNNKRQAKEEG